MHSFLTSGKLYFPSPFSQYPIGYHKSYPWPLGISLWYIVPRGNNFQGDKLRSHCKYYLGEPHLMSNQSRSPQASAMKRSDPHHQHQRHRDGGEALVSPDGTVTEAPRTVKKVLGPGCLFRRARVGGGTADPLGAAAPPSRPSLLIVGAERSLFPVNPLSQRCSHPGPSAGERRLPLVRLYLVAGNNMEVALSPAPWNSITPLCTPNILPCVFSRLSGRRPRWCRKSLLLMRVHRAIRMERAFLFGDLFYKE